MKGSKVIHINSDLDYGCNVRKGEIWINKTATDELNDLISDIQLYIYYNKRIHVLPLFSTKIIIYPCIVLSQKP